VSFRSQKYFFFFSCPKTTAFSSFFLEEEEGLGGLLPLLYLLLCFVVVRRCGQELISPLVAFQCLLCVDIGRELRFSPRKKQKNSPLLFKYQNTSPEGETMNFLCVDCLPDPDLINETPCIDMKAIVEYSTKHSS
jgi:hypothetical protein